MNALRRWIRALALFASMVNWRTEMHQWREDHDDRNLRVFLGSETGKRLVEMMKFQEARMNADAVQAGASPQAIFRAGTAAGFRACVAWLLSLSAQIRPPQTPDNVSPRRQEPSELAERLAP